MVNLEEIHEFAIEEGIKEDPRSRDQIQKVLEKREEEYEKLEGIKEEMYDKDRLENPYDDSKVIYGGEEEVSKLAVGIDMEVQDILLIDRLNDRDDEGIDGIIGHHPEGQAMANFHEVLGLQVDVLTEGGIPVSQAEALVKPRSEEIKKGVHARNHPRTPRAAELMGYPFMTLHTIPDNHAYSFIKDYLEEEDPETLEDMMDALLELPEYKWSLEYGMGPQVHSGSKENRAGKIGVFGFTGGTDLGEDVIEKMMESGVDTMVAMHAPKKQIEEADEKNINIVTAGHMPSDSLGINLLLDKLENEFDLKFKEMSGFKRVRRD